METSHDRSLKRLEDKLGYRFKQRELLKRALTHSSYLQHSPEVRESNQRLEFLGDTVLQMVLTEAIFFRYPQEREGQLSKRRSLLTRGSFLAELARTYELAEALLLAPGEESSGGRQRDSALEDAFEALMGALYIDAGMERAKQLILGIFQAELERTASEAGEEEAPYARHENPKGLLQERVQPVFGNNALSYELSATHGEDHNRSYEMSVYLHSTKLGTGSGSSKKAAEINAARMALATLDNDGLPKL